MTTTEQRMADALRFIAQGHYTAEGCQERARQALAAYDAWPERMATDYRVTTEWDAFDADSPRAAAVEVWQRIRESAGPVFTVRCSDGRVLDVDLSDETDEGGEA